jgi:hypothetical protein
MNQLIKTLNLKRAYLARLYSLCSYFAEDDISISIENNNIIFGAMSPMSSFEFFIQKPPNRSLFEFDDKSIIEPQNIQFTVSKDDFIKILAPFSKTGGLRQPKKDSDIVSLEIRTTGVIFLQSTLNHESNEIKIKLGDGTWNSLPDEDLEFSISPNMLSEYILRMAASGDTKVKFRQESSTLWIESDAGKEKIPMESTKPRNCQINIGRITLLKVKAQLTDYENCKVGVRDNFIIIEGQWEQGICKWKLDAIHEFLSN